MNEPAPIDLSSGSFQLVADGDMADVVVFGAGMALLAWLLWLVYRTMQKPRLPVNRPADRPPFATWAGVLRYLFTTPFIVGFWMIMFLVLLSAASTDRTAEDVIVATAAVIGGARLLAHCNEEIAHELAKTVPIAILGFIIIGGGFAGTDGFLSVLDQALGLGHLVDTYWLGLILFDIALTVIWFVAIRWRWTRAERREERGRPEEGFWGRLSDRLRSIGYVKPL